MCWTFYQGCWKVTNVSYIQICQDTKQQEGGTIPADIMVTPERPDLVIINRDFKWVNIFELTIPFETRIDISHSLKEEKYHDLKEDIKRNGWFCDVDTIEIGSRGLITRRNKSTIQHMLTISENSTPRKEILKTLSKLAVLGSYKIFISRNEETWMSPEYIVP